MHDSAIPPRLQIQTQSATLGAPLIQDEEPRKQVAEKRHLRLQYSKLHLDHTPLRLSRGKRARRGNVGQAKCKMRWHNLINFYIFLLAMLSKTVSELASGTCKKQPPKRRMTHLPATARRNGLAVRESRALGSKCCDTPRMRDGTAYLPFYWGRLRCL